MTDETVEFTVSWTIGTIYLFRPSALKQTDHLLVQQVIQHGNHIRVGEWISLLLKLFQSVPTHLLITKSFGLNRLTSCGDFDGRCVDCHRFLGGFPCSLFNLCLKNFVVLVVGDRFFLPMMGDAQLHVMGASGQFLEGPWFNALKDVLQTPLHALDAHLD
ncbi:hypothetical protein ACFXTO_024621 [Malus domestica]